MRARRQGAEHTGAAPPDRRGADAGAGERAAHADATAAAAAAREAALEERERSLAAQVRRGAQQACLMSDS